MTANKTLLRMKYPKVVKAFAEKSGMSVQDALDFFYHSTEYQLIREGVSDLHCMSEDYLAEDLMSEYKAA